MKIWRIFLAISAIIVLGFCGISVAFVVDQLALNVPPTQIVDQAHNICLEFRSNEGSNESLYVFTHYCDIPLKRDSHGLLYDKSTYIDLRETMECPWIEVADKDNDGYKEIYLAQDWFCKEFAHPWGKDPKRLVFRLDSDGRFIEIAREE
jgi:hypothetical protein